MCGIAGIYNAGPRSGANVDRTRLIAMREHMISRGPDDQGLWISDDQRIGLAHRRLAVIDQSQAGRQPMMSTDQRHVIVFNGEIYNHQALRRSLEAKGETFASASDTEVLLVLYRHYGREMLQMLRGMFALAIWDVAQRGLFLARDPYGIKPLYFSSMQGQFRFGSQVRALSFDIDSPETNPVAEASFLLTGSVMEPSTWVSSVRAIPAGHWMWVDGNGVSTLREYTDIASYFQAPANNVGDMDAGPLVTAALRDSVSAHLVADVPVGSFLSAGIDSGVISSLASEALDGALRTITLGFASYVGTPDDEVPLASMTADHIGSAHSVHLTDQQELDADLTAIFDAMDQPTIDGLNTWFVSKAAAAAGIKVMLSGVGGDELFGGYPSFSDIPRWRRQFGWLSTIPGVQQCSRLLAGAGATFGVPPKAFGLAAYAGTTAGAYMVRRGLFMPWEIAQFMGAERAEFALSQLNVPACFSPHSARADIPDRPAIAEMESRFYLRNQLLRDTDWASMAHSLEVRTPLVDAVLAQQIAPIATSVPDKQLLSQAVTNALPAAALGRSKTGFTTPMAQWLGESKELDSWRRYRSLRPERTHWSRRYAACVHNRFFGSQ